jgi:hypothetical protein
LRDWRAFIRIYVGLHDVARHARRAHTTISHGLTFNGALNHATAHRFGRRQFAHPSELTLDVALTCYRIGHDFLAGGEVGRIGVHRLCDPHRATLQQCDARSSSGELCNSHFKRHRTKPYLQPALGYGVSASSIKPWLLVIA